MIVIGLNNSKLLARGIAKKLNIDYFDLEINHSVDGEMRLKFDKDVEGERVFLVQSFYPHQNSSLVEVLFAANLTRDLKAKEIILIAPYLSYLREDLRKEKYGSVSSSILGNVLSNNVDRIISVDPHLDDLKKFFSVPVYTISSIDLIRDYISKNYDENTMVVGPDENSRRLVMGLGKKFIVLKKKRKDEFNVKFEKGYNLRDKKIVVVDDMVVTGATMIGCIKYLGVKDADCITVHAVMTGDALKEIEKHANNVVSCNSILNETNKIDLSGLIAGKIKDEWAT